MNTSGREALYHLLSATQMFNDSTKILSFITPDVAKKRIDDTMHSCWEMLYHVVFWFEKFLDPLEGKQVDWKYFEEHFNWPTDKMMNDPTKLVDLKEKYFKQLRRAENLLNSIDLDAEYNYWQQKPGIFPFLWLINHNAHHFGQIITSLKVFGKWPEAN